MRPVHPSPIWSAECKPCDILKGDHWKPGVGPAESNFNRVRGLGVALCEKRVKELEMFSLMAKMLRRKVSAVFKYLAGCHMVKGQTRSA